MKAAPYLWPSVQLSLLGSCACKRESSSCIPQPGMGTTSSALAARQEKLRSRSCERQTLFIISSSTTLVSVRRN